MMMAGGLTGLVSEWLGAPATIFILALMSLAAALFISKLPQISD